MDDAPHTSDLDLAAVCTRDDLLALLRTVYIRADKPALRTLEARTRHSASPLSKTAVAEMLHGVRFPRKAVMVAFVRACGVPDDAIEPWRRAWEQVAVSEEASAQSGAAQAAGQHPLPGTPRSSLGVAGGTQTQNAPADRPSGALAAAEQTDSPSPQVSPVDEASLLKEISTLRSLLASVAESAAKSVMPDVEQALQSVQLPDKGLFEVNRDRVAVWLPGVSSWWWRCVSAAVCRGCTQCGRACAGWPGCGIRMRGGLRAWRAGSGFRKRNS